MLQDDLDRVIRFSGSRQLIETTCEHVHVEEAEFAACDQSQTWTEQSSDGRVAYLKI